MKYRVVEITYMNAEIVYAIEIQEQTNEVWKMIAGETYKTEVKAVDEINDMLAAVAASTVDTRVVLPGEYE
jgi:hypothetical protein